MGGSSIISAIHHLKLASDYMNDFLRERPTALLSRLFKNHISKLSWIINDIKSEPGLPRLVIDGITRELNSDIFQVGAINEKIALLNPDKRELIETAIDLLLKGEPIIIEVK